MRWENYPIFRHPSDVVQDGARLQWWSFQELGPQFQHGARQAQHWRWDQKMEKTPSVPWINWINLNLSGLLGFDDLVLVHLFTVWDPWNVSSFFKTFLFPYISIATICYLNFDKAAARAFHQGSVRHTRGLSSWPALDNALWRFCLEPDVPW